MTEATRVQYPPDAPTLVRGLTYWWQVAAVTEHEEDYRGPYWIRLAPADEAQRVQALLSGLDRQMPEVADAARAMARALLLGAEGFRGEALGLILGDREPTPTPATVAHWEGVLSSRTGQ